MNIRILMILLIVTSLAKLKIGFSLVFVKFKDWLKTINTKGGLGFSDLTHFVQNHKLIQ